MDARTLQKYNAFGHYVGGGISTKIIAVNRHTCSR